MMDADYLGKKAAQCRRFADIATNQEIRDLLDALARELELKTRETAAVAMPAGSIAL